MSIQVCVKAYGICSNKKDQHHNSKPRFQHDFGIPKRIIGPLKMEGFEPVSAGAWVLNIVSFGPTDPSTTPSYSPKGTDRPT